MSIRKNSGPATVEAFRAAKPAVNAPSEGIAYAVWNLLKNRLVDVGGRRPRQIEDIAGSVLKRVSPTERTEVELVAMQALTVAVDTAMTAGREERALFINDVFGALATRWSPLYRKTPGRSFWNGEKKAETLIDARREMMEAGVDLDRLWTAVCDGVAGLYTVTRIGGVNHARGRRVELVEGDLLAEYEQVISAWRRPALGRNRILLADTPMPPLKIANWTVAERDYDFMSIGEPTKEVIKVLESTRVFLDVGEVYKDVKRLQALVRGHEYAMAKADFWASWKGMNRRSPEFEKDHEKFLKHFKDQRRAYNRVVGRLRQAEAVAKQIDAHADKVDDYGHLEIKTAYYKTRNRRFQPRNLWPTEISSKEDAERTVIPDAEVFWNDIENDEFPLPDAATADWLFEEFRKKYGDAAVRYDNTIVVKNRPEKFMATTSPRGRWFQVRAQFDTARSWDTDEVAPDGTPISWADDYTGPRRPLVGFDASSSMYHLTAVALGWRDAEQLLEKTDFKALMASAIDVIAARNDKFHAPDATPKQRRNAMGALAPVSYGAGLAGVLRKIRSDSTKYGTNWGDSKNLKVLLDEGRKVNAALAVVMRMRDEYMGVARALGAAAAARSAYDGLTVYDPFDGTAARWHRPITREKILRNGAVSLVTKVPFGEPNAEGFYPANYAGREITLRSGKTRRVDTKGSVANLVVPGLVHALDASFAAHVVLALRARDVRDIVIVNDCFLVPSDARPLLEMALEDAAKPWMVGLGPFYRTFEEYLAHDPVWGQAVRKWRTSWETRLAGCRAGTERWPKFTFKDETTVALTG